MKNNELVVKSNRLIEASYRLDLVEQRVILLAIVNARETGLGLNSDNFLPVTAKMYAERYGIDEKNAYRQIKEAARTLYERGFVLHDTDPETGLPRVIKTRWLSAASYIDGAGVIQLQFAGAVVPYIIRLEAEFTSYRLEKVANMTSAHAIRLYELLMQWGSAGRRKVSLEWFKQVLQVDGYAAIKDFKKYVIDTAIGQINRHSDLTVAYEQVKTGRKVTHFVFRFDRKDATQSPAAVRPARAAGTGGNLLVEFFSQSPRYARRYGNIAYGVAACTPAIIAEFQQEFVEWRDGLLAGGQPS